MLHLHIERIIALVRIIAKAGVLHFYISKV